MKGQENAPINNFTLAMLLESYGSPLNVIIGKPSKGKKLKVKSFSKRLQKPAKKTA